MKRIKIERICARCKKLEFVRKDGAGIHCRSCRAKINSENKKPKDITGIKFGKITVISFAFIKKCAYWNCLCDCGKECIVSGAKLRFGATKSCGCISKTRSGLSKSDSFRNWKAMMQRCYDKSVEHYARYGEKGIKVCERWKNSFENFLQDMGERPKGKTLDRIDSEKGYSPENCKWSTYTEQARNKKTGMFITAFGKTKRLIEWAEETGLNWSTIRKRIITLKWKPEEALGLQLYEKR